MRLHLSLFGVDIREYHAYVYVARQVIVASLILRMCSYSILVGNCFKVEQLIEVQSLVNYKLRHQLLIIFANLTFY